MRSPILRGAELLRPAAILGRGAVLVVVAGCSLDGLASGGAAGTGGGGAREPGAGGSGGAGAVAGGSGGQGPGGAGATVSTTGSGGAAGSIASSGVGGGQGGGGAGDVEFAFEGRTSADAPHRVHVRGLQESGIGTPITSELYDSVEPALSPDGSRIAYAQRSDGRYRIYLLQLDGASSPILLTSPAQFEGDSRAPAFSSDGKRLVFASVGGASAASSRLYQVALDASPIPAPQPIGVLGLSGESGFTNPAYALGNPLVLYADNAGSEATTKANDVFRLDLENGTAENLTNGGYFLAREPAPRPGAAGYEFLAFASNVDGPFRIYGIVVEQSYEAVQGSPTSLAARQPCWYSPEGMLVAGSVIQPDSNTYAYDRIYALAADASGIEIVAKPITPEGFSASHPTVAYDLVQGIEP